jgi:hypothetical protein
MKGWGALIVAGALAGCAAMPHHEEASSCPAGQESLKTAQLFFGRNVGAKPTVSQADFQRFMDAEVTPRFPDGLTVLEGGGQWRGSENQLIREAAKVVLIVLPKGGDAPQKIDAVRTAYKKKFNQDSVLLITQPACVSF